jgi:hypothetical protein
MSFNLRFGLFSAVFLLQIQGASSQTSDWMSLVSSSVGLDTASAFNIYVADVNNDHYPDVVALKGNWGVGSEDALQVLLNVPGPNSPGGNKRMFVDITGTSSVNAVLPPLTLSRGTLVAALADVNNDGNIDLVRGNYYHRLEYFTDHGDRCEVLLGDGKGHFTPVPGALSELGLVNTTGFSFLDYDRDGNIDLFVATWFKDYTNNVWDQGYLMKGNGDGTFTNVTTQAGITQKEPMYGCSVVDWNNDGWPDIATGPYCRTGGQLWKNNGNGTFTNVAATVNYNAHYLPGDNGQALCLWNPAPEDFDNDGDMDFFFALVHGGNDANEGRSVIMRNGGPSADYKLTHDRSLLTKKPPYSSHNGDYDAAWFDLDNDGRVDLAMIQGNYMPASDRLFVFHQRPDNSFMDITGDLGLIKSETRDLHAMEVLDYDLDGDDDLMFCHNAAPRELHLLENRIGQKKNWTAVHLRAPQGVNKSCIGARVYVWAGGVRRMREVYAGRGNNGGQQPFALVFGLGDHTIDSIQVDWPDAARTTTTVHHPPHNRYLEITATGLSVPGSIAAPTRTLPLYPNPARDFLIVQTKDDAVASASVYALSGRTVIGEQRFPPGQATVCLPLKELPAGQYIVRVTTAAGEVSVQRFVKLTTQN